MFSDGFDRVHDVNVAHGVGRICRLARVKAHEAAQDGALGVRNPVAVGVKVVLAVFLFAELLVQDQVVGCVSVCGRGCCVSGCVWVCVRVCHADHLHPCIG